MRSSRGVLLGGGGALLLSFDGLLIRLQAMSQAGVTFWRGVLTAVGFGVILIASRRSSRAGVSAQETGGWWPLLALVTLMVVGTVTWVLALTHTTVAHVMVIVSAVPLASGLLGQVLLRESLPLRTWLAGAAVLAGVAVAVSASLGGGGLQGDLWAVANMLLTALMFNMVRRYSGVNRPLALSIAGVVMAALAVPFGIQLPDLKSLAAASFDGLVILPVGLLMLTLAPKYLPAAEVGLLLLIETVLAPVWVFLVLGEALTPQIVLSAAIVICAIAVHSVLELRESHKRELEPAPT